MQFGLRASWRTVANDKNSSKTTNARKIQTKDAKITKEMAFGEICTGISHSVSNRIGLVPSIIQKLDYGIAPFNLVNFVNYNRNSTVAVIA